MRGARRNMFIKLFKSLASGRIAEGKGTLYSQDDFKK